MVVHPFTLAALLAFSTGAGGSDARPAESAPARVTAKQTGKFDHRGACSAVAFSPDGEYLLTAGADNNPELVGGQSHNGRVRMWHLATRKEHPGPQPLRYGIQAAALAPDGRYLAVSTGGALLGPRGRPTLVDPGTLALFDTTGKQKTAHLRGPALASPSLAFSATGKTLAAGTTRQNRRGQEMKPGGVVVLWDVATGKEAGTLKGHKGEVQAVAFSPDDKLLVSASRVPVEPLTARWGGEVKVWDVAARKEVSSLGGHDGQVWCVAFSPDGKLVASGGDDGTVRLWDVARGKEVAALAGHRGAVYALAFAPGGHLLASGGGRTEDRETGELKVWHVAARKEAATLGGHAVAVRSVTFDPTGKNLASGDGNGVVQVWAVDAHRP